MAESADRVAVTPEQVRSGDVRALARAATAVEGGSADELLQALFAHTGGALTLGITGPPGAGKSTLADQLAAELRSDGKRVGIIAVDPTSPFSGGAILGDRIRMQRHHADPGVFIRSMATRGMLGGVARTTADMTLLFDAAGIDVILVETVGVGQDEVDIARLADVTAVVLVPGMGDDVQAIKAGIMEIADVFVINKSDQPGAARLEREIRAWQGVAARHEEWVPPTIQAIATEGQGIREILSAVDAFLERVPKARHAAEIWRFRLREMYRGRMLAALPDAEIERAAQDVAERKRDPYTIVNDWLRRN